MTQSQALSLLKTGANVFLTGEPGSGKTHTVNEFVAYLRRGGVEPAITASTGIAATHIGGYTIHAWCGIGIKDALSRHDLVKLRENKRVARRVKNAHTLIIDEISMLSAQTFEAADAACRTLRQSSEPFGGMQLVVVGDFFQLPPVVRPTPKSEDDAQSSFFPDEPTPVFAFDSPLWNKLAFTVCYLHEQHRQEDPKFLELLTAIRSGTVIDEHRETIRQRFAEGALDGITKLFPHNASVDRINESELKRLSGEVREFVMESKGAKPLAEALKKNCLSPERLLLKIGARVLFTKNDPEYRFVNGTLGEVVAFSLEDGYPLVRIRSGRTILATPVEWRIEDEGRPLATITQIPLRLAWAITIHKSQGMSLDAAHMDLSRTFEYGQGYVAISRVRTLAGLSVAGFNPRALEVDPHILERDAEFRGASEEAEARLEQTPEEVQREEENNFIKQCGGITESENFSTNKPNQNFPIEKFIEKWDTLHNTLELVRMGKTIEETAAARGITPGTVVAHLEKLKMNNELKPADVAHLARGQEELMAKIHAVIKTVEGHQMKPIYEYFNGEIPYDTIRLARVLFEE